MLNYLNFIIYALIIKIAEIYTMKHSSSAWMDFLTRVTHFKSTIRTFYE